MGEIVDEGDGSLVGWESRAGVAELADARDSKSRAIHLACGFDPHLQHHASERFRAAPGFRHGTPCVWPVNPFSPYRLRRQLCAVPGSARRYIFDVESLPVGTMQGTVVERLPMRRPRCDSPLDGLSGERCGLPGSWWLRCSARSIAFLADGDGSARSGGSPEYGGIHAARFKTHRFGLNIDIQGGILGRR
jgi:hypothetical protein